MSHFVLQSAPLLRITGSCCCALQLKNSAGSPWRYGNPSISAHLLGMTTNALYKCKLENRYDGTVAVDAT